MRDMATSRTTGPIIDFDTDEDLQEALAEASSGATELKIRVFGEEITLRTVINGYSMLSVLDGDAYAMREAMLGLVIPDQRESFGKLLAQQPNLDAKALAVLYGKMVEAVSARPTQLSSVSSSSPKKRTSATRSKAE